MNRVSKLIRIDLQEDVCFLSGKTCIHVFCYLLVTGLICFCILKSNVPGFYGNYVWILSH